MRISFMRGVVCPMMALVLIALTPGTARAQGRQPVVLQHGFNSTEATWDRMSQWLVDAAYVKTSRYSTGRNSLFSRQASKLKAATVDLPDTTIFIGHSNGGVVSRHLSHMRPMKGYITIGTPHRGAPLAAAMLNGTTELFAHTLQSTARQALETYKRQEFDHYRDWMRRVGILAATGQDWLGRLIGASVDVANLVDDLGETVLTDMNPASHFFSPWSGVNSYDALRAEARMMGSRRVAIATGVTAGYFPQWMIWKGLMPGQSAALSVTTDAVLVTLLLMYDHYSNYFEPEDPYAWEKQTLAHLWLWSAGVLGSMDLNWCYMIGAGSAFGCEAADGIVPLSHQRHPDQAAANVFVPGPAHQEQTSSPAVRDAVVEQLITRFKVPRAPGTIPPLGVYIEGSSGATVGVHTNTAYGVSGIGSYSYRWYVSGDGNYFADTGVTTPSYSHQIGDGQTFWIRVVVTSGIEQAAATKVLGPACYKICIM